MVCGEPNIHIYIYTIVYIPQLYYEIPLLYYCDIIYTVTKSFRFSFVLFQNEEESNWMMKSRKEAVTSLIRSKPEARIFHEQTIVVEDIDRSIRIKRVIAWK